MEKTYFWLKLHDNFFEQEEIRLIESIPNGKDYIIFYLKLLLKGIKNDGKLLFKDIIPYTPETLSVITNTNVDIVKQAIDVFIQFGMISKFDNGILFLNQCNNLVGKDTSMAERQRKCRENKQLQLKCDNVTNLSQNCHTEIEIEKEIEIDKNNISCASHDEKNEIEKIPYEEIKNMYNEMLPDHTTCKFLSDKRKRQIKTRWRNELKTLEDWQKFFNRVSRSDFLCGRTKNTFWADFDWLICPSNCVKILEDKYNNLRYEK